MKNKTIKTLVLTSIMLLGLSQVHAVIEVDPADKLTMNVWSSEQIVELSKEDSITNIAWTQQDSELIAQGEYEINAFAADLEEAVESTDKADTLTKNVWTEARKTEVREDLIARKAWL